MGLSLSRLRFLSLQLIANQQSCPLVFYNKVVLSKIQLLISLTLLKSKNNANYKTEFILLSIQSLKLVKLTTVLNDRYEHP